MEYAVLALPVVLMAALFGLERVERWMDEGRPRAVSAEISPVRQRPRAAQRSPLAAHHGGRWRPIRLVGELARARVHYRHPPSD